MKAARSRERRRVPRMAEPPSPPPDHLSGLSGGRNKLYSPALLEPVHLWCLVLTYTRA